MNLLLYCGSKPLQTQKKKLSFVHQAVAKWAHIVQEILV